MGNLTDHFSSSGGGNVLEIISYNCDGRAVIINGNNYTAGTTTSLPGSSSDHDVTGSEISYTPPDGTKVLVYEIDITSTHVDNTGLCHFWLDIDGTEVTRSRRTIRGTTWQQVLAFKFAIEVGALTDNLAHGKVGAWTSNKTLKIRTREYSSSYEARTNNLVWWDGAGITQPTYMNLKLTALS